MSLKAMVWGKYTDHAASLLDRLILMQLGDNAREEDHTGTVVYRVSTSLGILAELAVTDEGTVRACLDGLTERGAVIPAQRREHGDADLVFELAVDH